MQISPIKHQKVHNLHICKKNYANKVPKGASTKMHKCLVGSIYLEEILYQGSAI